MVLNGAEKTIGHEQHDSLRLRDENLLLIETLKQVGLRINTSANYINELTSANDINELKCVKDIQRVEGGLFNSTKPLFLHLPEDREVIETMSGFSFVENFGRWTEADVARIVMRRLLPRRLKLRITMFASQASVGQPMLVVVGGTSKVLRPASTAIRSYTMNIKSKFPSRTIEFFIPNALSLHHLTDGKSHDERRLGIAIQALEIKAIKSMFAFGEAKGK